MSFAAFEGDGSGGPAPRRRRTVATALAGTALAAVAVGFAAVPAASAEASTVQRGATSTQAQARTAAVAVAAAPVAAPAPARSSAPVPPVVRVRPGKLDIGGGYWLILTHDSVTLGDATGQVGPQYTDNGNQAPGSINLQMSDRAIGGLYLGAGAASATVTVGGTVHRATVVTLDGHPGWSEIYVVLPAAADPTLPITNSVYDKAGHLLATFTSPGFPAK